MLWETQFCNGASQFNWHIAQECQNLGIPKLKIFFCINDAFWCVLMDSGNQILQFGTL